MGDSIKDLTEVQEHSVHCSPLVPQAADFILQAYQISQA